MNWVPVTGTFVAEGHEKYMVLGNFKSDAGTQTMVINPTFLPKLFNDNYIDDVSLVDMELPAYAGRDTSIWAGDSVFVGREPDVGIDYACQWYQLPNNTVPIDTIAGMWVKPTVNTTYIVRQQLWCSGVKWDTVLVHMLSVGMEENELADVRIYPNPTSRQISFSGLPAGEIFTVTFSDATGRIVYRNQISDASKIETDLAEGLYLVTVNSETASMTRRIAVVR